MKRKTTILLTILAFFAVSLQAQVIFDPATYPVDSLPDGMEIVNIDGTKYLKATLNGWNSSVKIYDVIIAPGHTRMRTEVKLDVGVGGFTIDQVNTFLKLTSPGWNELIANGQGSSSEFHNRTIDGLSGGDTIDVFQFAGQETQSWGAVVGDTLYVGKVVAENPVALLDPLLVVQDSLPAGWSIVTIDDEAYFQVLLNGWNSSFEFYKSIDSTMVPENVKAFKTMAKYAVGTSGFELGVINTFIKFSDPSWTEVVAIGAASSTEFKKYNKAITPGSTLGVFQVAGQETQSWSAVVGDTLWVGALVAEKADSIKISSEGDATTIETNGGTLQLTATLYPMDLAVPSVTWMSSDNAIATVDEAGMVTAVANGDVTISASAEDGSGKKDEFMITLSNQMVMIESIAVSGAGDATTIETAGGTLQMAAAVLPEGADETMIEWSVSPEGVATIDAAGLLTAVANGVVTVTATATDGSGITGTADITVSSQNVGIETMNSEKLNLYPNPVKAMLYVENAGSVQSMDIVSLSGKVVMSISNISEKMAIDVSKLGCGVYFIRAFQAGEVETYKLVK